MRDRYTVVIANRSSGLTRRFTIRLGSVVALALAVVTLPLAIAIGIRWMTAVELQHLRVTNTALELENAGYRAVSGDLTLELATLQAVVSDLQDEAWIEDRSLEAMEKLPGSLKVRLVGGATDHGAVNPLVSAVLTSPQSAFGLLSELLVRLKDRLHGVRFGVERRNALAAATPSVWPTQGWLSSTYGYRIDPLTGVRAFHRGLDLSTDIGDPIFATAAGRVESARRSGDLGNLLVLDHGFGLTTRYGHLSRFAVRAGAWVERGDLIGYVGSTGRTTGSHVHYEIWADGRPVNPLRLLPEIDSLSAN